MQQNHLATLLVAVLVGGLASWGCAAKKSSPAEKKTAKASATPAATVQPAPTASPAPAKAAAPAPAAPAAKGLTITKAVYGDLPTGATADVTDKVKAMVKDNSLTVGATNENFGDPAEGIAKKLRVDYLLNGEKKSVEVEEGQTLTIPVKP